MKTVLAIISIARPTRRSSWWGLIVSLGTMAHGGSELFLHTGLLAPIFEASFYLVSFRVFLFQVSLWCLDDCNVNSHLASRIPASSGTRPAGSEGRRPWHRLWLVIVPVAIRIHHISRYRPPTHLPLHSTYLPRKPPQRHSLAPYRRQQTNPRNLQHKMWIVDWCMLMLFPSTTHIPIPAPSGRPGAYLKCSKWRTRNIH